MAQSHKCKYDIQERQPVSKQSQSISDRLAKVAMSYGLCGLKCRTAKQKVKLYLGAAGARTAADYSIHLSKQNTSGITTRDRSKQHNSKHGQTEASNIQKVMRRNKWGNTHENNHGRWDKGSQTKHQARSTKAHKSIRNQYKHYAAQQATERESMIIITQFKPLQIFTLWWWYSSRSGHESGKGGKPWGKSLIDPTRRD